MWWDGERIRFDRMPVETQMKPDEKAAMLAKLQAEGAKVNQAIEASKGAVKSTGMEAEAPRADKFEAHPKIVKEADLKVIDPKVQPKPVKMEN